MVGKHLLSCQHSNHVLYQLVMAELPNHSEASALLLDNPVMQVSWSTNGQFIMILFKDKVNKAVYQLFTKVFSAIYGTDVDQGLYLCADSSSIIKWTSCPTFDDAGKEITPAQYLQIIKLSTHFQDVDIIGSPKMIRSSKSLSNAYCTLKLWFRDSPKGNVLNRLVNKPFTFFGWPHRTLAWIHKPAIIQCTSCLWWGHHVSACKSTYPFCTLCTGPHQTHSHDAFAAKGLVNSAITIPQCINCTAAKKFANHEATDKECPFFKARHSRSAITALLTVIWNNKFTGHMSPFDSHHFGLVNAEVTDSLLSHFNAGSILVNADGSTITVPPRKTKGKTKSKATSRHWQFSFPVCDCLLIFVLFLQIAVFLSFLLNRYYIYILSHKRGYLY